MSVSRRTRPWRSVQAKGGGALIVAAALLTGVAAAAGGGSQWNSAGGDLQNTRFQANEKTLSVSNVGGTRGEVVVHDGRRRLRHAGGQR